MNKTVITSLAIILCAGIISLYIWSSYNRYYIMTSDKGVAYEIDKKTGQSWVLSGGNKHIHTSDDFKRKAEKLLPLSDTGSITGNAGLKYGRFEGKLYNGSDWIITRAIINVTVFGSGGTTYNAADVKFDNNDIFDDLTKKITLVPIKDNILWSRDISIPVTIKPLTTNDFTAQITGGEDAIDVQWYIKDAFGYQE